MVLSFSSNADESCFYPDKIDNGTFSHSDECGSIEGDRIKLGKNMQLILKACPVKRFGYENFIQIPSIA